MTTVFIEEDTFGDAFNEWRYIKQRLLLDSLESEEELKESVSQLESIRNK